MELNMLKVESTALVIVDVQGKLAHQMHEKQALFENLRRMIRGAQALGLPILWLEQLPDKLGATVPELAELLTDLEPIPKSSFSACRNADFLAALKALARKQVLVVGIEAHICVYQTATELKDLNYQVEVVTDAISSRRAENKHVALRKMNDCGVGLTSTEMALFELLGVAEGEQFKAILQIVK